MVLLLSKLDARHVVFTGCVSPFHSVNIVLRGKTPMNTYKNIEQDLNFLVYYLFCTSD